MISRQRGETIENQATRALRPSGLEGVSIWIVNPYGAAPEPEYGAPRSHLMASALAARGASVKCLVPSFNHTKKAQQYHLSDACPRQAGVEIEFLRTPGYRHHVGVRRLWFEFIYAARLIRTFARSQARPDIIIAGHPFVFTGWAAAYVARRSNSTFVVDVIDLWPEIFQAAVPKWLKHPGHIGIEALRRARNSLMAHADAIVTVSKTYTAYVRQQVPSMPPSRIRTVYWGAKLPCVQATAVLGPHVISEMTTVLYAGTLGENYDLMTVIEAAGLLQNQLGAQCVRILVAGSGPVLHALQFRASELNLTNVEFLGWLAPESLPTLYANADIGLAPYCTWSTVSLPIKAFEYLAYGLPIVTSLTGEMNQLLSQARCGLTYLAGDANSLALSLQQLIADPELRLGMRVRASRASLRFGYEQQYSQFASFVQRVHSVRIRRA
jgi:glycosyltransferase involved in cell wall biosynthesis